MPPTVSVSYSVRWTKTKIDLLELVTLRESGWEMKRLAARFGVGKSTVSRKLQKLNCRGGAYGRGLVDKLVTVAVMTVVGLWIAHPRTWRQELAKVEYKIIKEATNTRSWGCPSIWGPNGCKEYDPKRYR